MTDLLIYGDTVRSPEMRHELPLIVPDPFLYVELGGRRHVVVSSIERSRIAELDPELTVHPFEAFGIDELLARGLERHEAEMQARVRACQELSLNSASVPTEFAIDLADRLRATGIELKPDHRLFSARRRAKNDDELAGIRRAQRAAEAGMRAATELLRAAEPGPGGLVAGAEPLTCERLKDAVRDAIIAGGCGADDFVVSHGAQTAIGHELGSGQIQQSEPVIIDLWPRDHESACFADMTRTFVIGEIPAELRHYHELTLESLRRSQDAVRPGASGREVFVDWLLVLYG